MATLVIIDMQPTFTASQETWMIANIRREIRQAKKKNEAIIFVRFSGGSVDDTTAEWQIDNRLLATVGKYGRVFFAVKTTSDGSKQILRIIKRNNLDTDLLVTGVNTDCCVADTVNSLSVELRNSDIRVMEDCCHTEHATATYDGRRHIAKRKNIRLLKAS